MESKDFDLESLRQGDLKAWDNVFKGMYDPIYSLARQRVGTTEGEDVAQSVFIQAWKSIHQFNGLSMEQFVGWLQAIALNKSRAVWRSSRNHQSLPKSDSLANLRTDPTFEVLRKEERDRLEQGLSRLSPQHRGVVTMYYYNELTCYQIAEVLGIPVGTVWRWLHEARKSLRRDLAE